MHEKTSRFLSAINENFLFNAFNYKETRNRRKFLSHSKLANAKRVLTLANVLHNEITVKPPEHLKIQALVEGSAYIIEFTQQYQQHHYESTLPDFLNYMRGEREKAALTKWSDDPVFGVQARQLLLAIENLHKMAAAHKKGRVKLPFFNTEELVMAGIFSVMVVVPLSLFVYHYVASIF